MHVESSNFDIGVKNYKKNRLVVNPLQLKNEILYTIDRSNKPSFVVSFCGYVNDSVRPRSFFNVLRDLEVSDLSNSFNFFINRQGNIITNVEMVDSNYFYPKADSTINVVVCLSCFESIENNSGNPEDFYSPEQVQSLNKLTETFAYDTKSTLFKELSVPNDLSKIVNVGFDISKYVKQQELV